jgi:catechol 2,3-dioxygenase-like lactoylglutathione lyase family enzyme
VPERVTGIGGVFFRARDPERLRDWYAQHLGLELRPFGGAVFSAEDGDITVWHAATADDEYFGPPEQRLMLNYRVSDLDAMLAQLRGAGVPTDERVEESAHGRFGWATDPEGNRLELWQPPRGEYPAD